MQCQVLSAAGVQVPTQTTVDWTVEYIWKSVPFDRMQTALRSFAVDQTSVSGYLYHKCACSVHAV